MSGSHEIVFVIDDDASLRDALRRLICSVGLQAELFGSAKEVLDRKRPEIPACMTLDIGCQGSVGWISSAGWLKLTSAFRLSS